MCIYIYIYTYIYIYIHTNKFIKSISHIASDILPCSPIAVSPSPSGHLQGTVVRGALHTLPRHRAAGAVVFGADQGGDLVGLQPPRPEAAEKGMEATEIGISMDFIPKIRTLHNFTNGNSDFN